MDFSNVTIPTKADVLVSFIDIQGFAKIAHERKDLIGLFDLLNGWATIIIREVERTCGRVIKFIGDSCLIVFPENEVDRGVLALLTIKEKTEAFLKSHGFAARMKVTAHFGEVVIGEFGTGSCKLIDVFGDTVNLAAVLERNDYRGHLILSAQTFRKLTPATRKRFHKYAQPVVYIAAEEERSGSA